MKLEMPILIISVWGVGVSIYVLAHVCFIYVFVWGTELEHRVFYMLLTELCSQVLFDL